ncbi:MAG: polyprenyl synthetase family protein [Bryobacterales bacterium]|nr:polyprenyl synthetase family protein [Bryobacterales bacterium]
MLVTIEPRPVPPQADRPPQDNIPPTRVEREGLRAVIARYVEAHRGLLTPPLVLDELRTHAEKIVARAAMPMAYVDYVGVLLNNEVWREQLAAVPFERRLLLLPKCLRVEDRCPAPFDELGLLCKQCGLCTIQDLQAEAERLGYAVLVAEGSALVMALIQTGKIDAIVGVSCLSVLEKAFPYMESAAIPGVAIPLLQDDCKDTTIDVEWVWDMVHLTSEDRTWRLDIDRYREDVKSWFTPAALDELLGGPAQNPADRIAREWLAQDGKRWRPLLTACAFEALRPDPQLPLPDAVRRVAVAVECFHKASLIHDDIEDDDATRYGTETVHARHGVPVALNVGDLLLGEGYRLLATSGAPAPVVSAMMRIAADGHRTLCLGQGAELDWMRHRRALSVAEVLAIFRQKTAPAFEVALRLGAALAEADAATHETLSRYSEALGIAYQIRDDLDDLAEESGCTKPTLPMAELSARARGADRALVEQAWREGGVDTHGLMAHYQVAERLGHSLESYKEAAIRTLPELHNSSLKGLLRRMVGKIFRAEIQGWCSEFEARNAAGSEARAQVVG